MAPVLRRRLAAAILALTVVAVAAGCEQPAEDAAMTDGLLVLSGDVGSVTLRVREGGRGRRIELPDPATSWVAAGRANVLLATLVDGRTYVSGPLGDEDLEWRLVEPVTLTDLPPQPPLFFGTWDPPGAAYAQLGADFSDGGGMRAVVVDPALEQAVEVAVEDGQAAPAPAAWIDDDRVVIVAAAGDDGEAVIVDSATQETQSGPGGVRLVATSADASTAAVWRGSGEPVEIQSTESWLAEQPASIRIDVPDGAAGPAVMALDAEGERLAVVWSDGGGTPLGIAVYAASSNWGRVASLELGEAAAATVAWLR
jgi:hypothetical protein